LPDSALDEQVRSVEGRGRGGVESGDIWAGQPRRTPIWLAGPPPRTGPRRRPGRRARRPITCGA